MTIIPRGRVVALAATALIWLPVAASAQSIPKSAPAAPASVEARVEAYAKILHAQLQITPAERAEWKHYVAVMHENARDMDRLFMKRVEELGSMNAVESLKSYERLAKAHVERLQKLIPAFEKLYASMSADQKKIADEVFRARAEKHAAAGARGTSHPNH